MSQGTDGEEIDACFCERTEGGFVDPAGGFEEGAALVEVDSVPDLVGSHIVEKKDIGFGIESLLNFVEVGDFDLDLEEVRGEATDLFDSQGDRSGGADMVLFDQST